MTKAKKAIITTVIVLVMLVFMIFGIIMIILFSGYEPEQTTVYYKDISKIMEDDIVYLSDDFFEKNSFERKPYLNNNGKYDVILTYDKLRLGNPDFSARVEGVSSCCYEIQNAENSQDIPVTASINFVVGEIKRKHTEYSYEYRGYKYAYFMSVDGNSVFYLKTEPKRNSICTINISIKINDAHKYTDEQEKERIEQVFKSIADNIQTYSEYVDKTN